MKLENTINVYYRARRDAAEHDKRLSSRERASELLGVSVSTLANYELDITKTVPPDAVVMMSDLYNAPELKSHYCANGCPIGKGMPIPTKIRSIEFITVQVIKALSQSMVEEVKTKLIEISAGEKSNKEKIQTVMWLLNYLDDLSQTLGELRLSCLKLLLEGGVNVRT